MRMTGADCHVHIIDRRFQMAGNRNYDPEDGQYGSAARFLSVLDAAGLSHGLIVAAEPYGHDPACILDAVAGSGGRLKAVALVSPDITEPALDSLRSNGVVGIRYNLTSFRMRQFLDPATPSLFERLAERKMYLQVHCEADELVEAMPMLSRHPDLAVIIDHFARPDLARGLDQPGFRALLELGRRGNIVKLSGPYRVSRQMPPYRDVEPFIAAAIEAFTPDRCVWGSDWPFTRVTERIDHGPEFACLQRWLPDEADRNKVLIETPRRLFGF
jgi:predicted TIM-barrel fold metal-dependent hydrolase